MRGAPVKTEPEAEGAEELDDNPAQSPARFAVVAGLLLGYILLFLPLGCVVWFIVPVCVVRLGR